MVKVFLRSERQMSFSLLFRCRIAYMFGLIPVYENISNIVYTVNTFKPRHEFSNNVAQTNLRVRADYSDTLLVA